MNTLFFMRLSFASFFLFVDSPRLANEFTYILLKYSLVCSYWWFSLVLMIAYNSLFLLIKSLTVLSICSFSDKISSSLNWSYYITLSFFKAFSNNLSAYSLKTIICFCIIYIFSRFIASPWRACCVSSLNYDISILIDSRWFL